MLASCQEANIFLIQFNFSRYNGFYTFYMLKKSSWGQWLKPSLSISSLCFPSHLRFPSPPSVGILEIDGPGFKLMGPGFKNRWDPALKIDGTRLQKLMGPGGIWTTDLSCPGVGPYTAWPPRHPINSFPPLILILGTFYWKACRPHFDFCSNL